MAKRTKPRTRPVLEIENGRRGWNDNGFREAHYRNADGRVCWIGGVFRKSPCRYFAVPAGEEWFGVASPRGTAYATPEAAARALLRRVCDPVGVITADVLRRRFYACEQESRRFAREFPQGLTLSLESLARALPAFTEGLWFFAIRYPHPEANLRLEAAMERVYRSHGGDNDPELAWARDLTPEHAAILAVLFEPDGSVRKWPVPKNVRVVRK